VVPAPLDHGACLFGAYPTLRPVELGPAAAERLRLIARVREQLERVNEQLSAWNEYLANRELPPDLRKYVPRPEHALDDLKLYHREFVEKLTELMEGDPERRHEVTHDPRTRLN
jgi:hypothetical protein